MYYIYIVKQTTNIKTNKTMAQTINLSAAEIKNNPSVIAQANEYFKNLVAKCKEHELPYIVHTIAEVGVENIFYVDRNYRGLYEDDDCTFTYWDNLNGKVINDYWGTHFAAPSFFLYEDNIIRFHDAAEAGLINVELLRAHKVEKMHDIVNRMQISKVHEYIVNTYPRVKVEGGRKFKGEGYFIEKITESSIYGDKIYAKILSTEDFQIHYCNYRFVQFVDAENILNAYKEYAHAQIEETLKNNPRTICNGTTYRMSEDVIPSIEKFVERYKNNVEGLVANAPDPEMYERNMKLAAKRAENFKNIIEWVKTNTDKTTDDEIMELALRILNKRY